MRSFDCVVVPSTVDGVRLLEICNRIGHRVPPSNSGTQRAEFKDGRITIHLPIPPVVLTYAELDLLTEPELSELGIERLPLEEPQHGL